MNNTRYTRSKWYLLAFVITVVLAGFFFVEGSSNADEGEGWVAFSLMFWAIIILFYWLFDYLVYRHYVKKYGSRENALNSDKKDWIVILNFPLFYLIKKLLKK